jgi:hypothetical protein
MMRGTKRAGESVAAYAYADRAIELLAFLQESGISAEWQEKRCAPRCDPQDRMEQTALDRLQGLKEQYAEIMRQEGHDRLEGWEERVKMLSDAINGIHAILLR